MKQLQVPSIISQKKFLRALFEFQEKNKQEVCNRNNNKQNLIADVQQQQQQHHQQEEQQQPKTKPNDKETQSQKTQQLIWPILPCDSTVLTLGSHVQLEQCAEACQDCQSADAAAAAHDDGDGAVAAPVANAEHDGQCDDGAAAGAVADAAHDGTAACHGISTHDDATATNARAGAGATNATDAGAPCPAAGAA